MPRIANWQLVQTNPNKQQQLVCYQGESISLLLRRQSCKVNTKVITKQYRGRDGIITVQYF